MRRRLLSLLVAAIVLLGGVNVYVLWSAARELSAAETILAAAASDPSTQSIREARSRVQSALARLNGAPARLARGIPVTRQNARAIEHIGRSLMPVLDSTNALLRRARRLEGNGKLIADGRVDVRRLVKLRGPIDRQIHRLTTLEDELRTQQSGWLLPSVWNAIDRLGTRTRSLRASLETSAEGLSLLRPMFGFEGERTYLIVLMNNAELRGAGGLPSGIGTLEVSNGRLTLGSFQYVGELGDPHPYRRVPAPADFRRRFGRYAADTTLWSNLTMSPDLHDVAEVAASLFELVDGRRTDGVMFLDPRGLAALMPPDATVPVPGTDTILSRGELAHFVYERAYTTFSDQRSRHRALLRLGDEIFRVIVARGVGEVREIGAAVAGGHVAFVPLVDDGQDLLLEAGATRSLKPLDADGLLVTVQATAAHKLDYYVDRVVEHRCAVSPDVASCTTEVRLANRVPDALSRFVAPERPYGLVKNFLEIYVPRSAELTAVELDGEQASFVRDHEDAYTSVGFNLEIRQSTAVTASVSYDLALDGAYRFVARPQPLARDAHIGLELEFPANWSVSGPGTVRRGVMTHEGPFIGTLEASGEPRQRTGLSRLWEAFSGFWNEPLF